MKINIKTLLIAAAFMFTSCDEFLEKPDTTGTVDQEAVYSSKKTLIPQHYNLTLFISS